MQTMQIKPADGKPFVETCSAVETGDSSGYELTLPRSLIFPLQDCYLSGIKLRCPAKGALVLKRVYKATLGQDLQKPDRVLDRRSGCWFPVNTVIRVREGQPKLKVARNKTTLKQTTGIAKQGKPTASAATNHATAAGTTHAPTSPPTSADDDIQMHDEQCRQRAPECVSALNVRRRWGEGVAADYNQSTCCGTHPVIREVVIDLIGALNQASVPWMLMAGSILGVIRHNNTQVPWETDGDIAVVFGERGEEDGSNATTMIPVEKIESFLTKDLVALLPGQWSVNQNHKGDHKHCIQYQFSKYVCVRETKKGQAGETKEQQQQQQQCAWSSQVDIFGYVWHAIMPERFIGGALRKNFNNPKW